MTTSRHVRADGRPDARLIVLGEAPAAWEVAQGRPFVGPSGQLMHRWMRDAGIERRDCWIDNVYPFRAPKDKIALVPKEELTRWSEDLHARLAALEDPWLIVPTGATALRALTGKGSIVKHRGSIYEYRDRRGRLVKVIPTIHAAAVLRAPKWEKRCRADWKRIAGDREFRELRLPEREHMIRPTLTDCLEFLEGAAAHADVLAVDVETPRKTELVEVPGRLLKSGKQGKSRWLRQLGEPRITCVGFSWDPSLSLTIPTTLEYWGSEEQLARAWRVVRALCTLPTCEKATHNGTFDAFYLADHGIHLRRWQWDTMEMHHALDALDAHALGYCASVDTREPYWKDDAKDEDGEGKGWAEPSAASLDTFWRYNGKDAAVTQELASAYHAALGQRLDWYGRHYRDVRGPLLRCMRHGLAVDRRAQVRRDAALHAQCVALEDRLAALAGEPLHRAKALSGKALQHFLYDTLGLPHQRDRATGSVSTKEVIVRRLMLRYPAKLLEAGQAILDHRRATKVREFLNEKGLDPDGRLRCSYKFTTETGRLASSKNPKRTGRNMQNIDREVRSIYTPDPGCIFLEADLSQAESRIRNVLTGHPRLVEIARTRDFDEHRYVASITFGVPPDRIDKLQRYIGKRTNHASGYGMRGRTYSEALLKDGYTYTDDECQGFINRLLTTSPYTAVVDWQTATRKRVMQHRRLQTSWGREWAVPFERLDDGLYRRAYAFVPQSEVADLLNQYGLVPLDDYLRTSGLPARINAQVHDAVLVSTPPEHAWELACALRGFLERPRTYWSPVTEQAYELVIPVEFKLGRTWAGDVEFKTLPSHEAFEQAAHALAP